jgi:hypothetical protein
MRAAGPWRWHCAVRNGALLPLTARLEEGFLQLAGRPDAQARPATSLERALQATGTLAGGVKFALTAASRGLHLRTDIVLLEEGLLLERVQRALAGFHQGYQRLKALDSAFPERPPAAVAGASGVRLVELLRETSWACSERGADEFSVDLRQDSAPPARITTRADGVMLSVDLARCALAAEAAPQALAVFLLTANSTLRLVRAHFMEAEGERRFGFQVCLPANPAVEELNHALAALAVAYRMCARETNVLLEDAAARIYLAARNVPIVKLNTNEKEN